MNSSNEHENMDTERCLDKLEEEKQTPPNDEESAVSDLLHVLGFKKKKSSTKDLPPVTQTPANLLVPVDLYEHPDAAAPSEAIDFENLDDADMGLVAKGSDFSEHPDFQVPPEPTGSEGLGDTDVYLAAESSGFSEHPDDTDLYKPIASEKLDDADAGLVAKDLDFSEHPDFQVPPEPTASEGLGDTDAYLVAESSDFSEHSDDTDLYKPVTSEKLDDAGADLMAKGSGFSERLDLTAPSEPTVFEGLDYADVDLAAEGSEEVNTEADFSDAAVVLTDTSAPPYKKPKAKKITITMLVILILGSGFIYALPYLTEPVPPGKDVVASYSGKNITIDDLKSFIALEQAKESEHEYCDKHGYNHKLCDPNEACESHPVDSLEGYRQMATNLAMEQMIQEWASTQGITQREDVRHGIKDLLDNESVSQLVDQLHEKEITPESIPSWEVQQYYDDNKDNYSGKSFAEVEDEIRQILVSKKDENFIPQYIEKLKQTAGLKVDFELLKVTEPSEKEISDYYKQNDSQYQVAEKAKALEIKIATDSAQSKAKEAIRKIRSGESFDSVAAAYGQGGKASDLSFEKGSGEAAIEAVIWKMQPGDISDPITNTDGSASIIRLINTTKAGTKSLSEVKSDIRTILLQKNMEREYTMRKDEALFSVHSRRYTLGDFYTEFKELSAEYQAQFSTFEQKQRLVEQLIAKELLLEETGDSSSDKKEQHNNEELKIQYLGQMLHQQEVDQKLIDPTEDEIIKFYNKNKAEFASPASVRMSLIWIDQGIKGEKAEQAKKKADEALSMLSGGTDFAEVAKKYSEDGSAASGGEIDDTFDQDHLPDKLGKAIFALQAGGTSDLIDYNYGYYIVKVRERTEARQMTYEESIEDIKAHLKEEKHSQIASEMEQTLLKNTKFIVYDKTLRKLMKEQKLKQNNKV